MDNVQNLPYAKWLEECISKIVPLEPRALTFGAILPDGEVFTGYYKCNSTDKAILAHNIYADAFLEIITANIGMIKEALEDYDESEEDSE